MNSLVVGGILNRIYDDFNMLTFSNRLHLQKIIYLLQVQGINLGYSFSLYLHGPYSTELTRQAYNVNNFSQLKKIKFEEEDVEKKFEEFVKRLGNNKKDDFWLEVASSICILKKMYPTKTKGEIISDIMLKNDSFKNERLKINKIWEEIKGWLI